MVYAKARRSPPAIQLPEEEQGGKVPERQGTFTRPVAGRELLIAAAVIGAAFMLVATGAGAKLWAHLVGPFDRRPAVTVADLLEGEGHLRDKARELCGWATREELRRPSAWNSAQRQSACAAARK